MPECKDSDQNLKIKQMFFILCLCGETICSVHSFTHPFHFARTCNYSKCEECKSGFLVWCVCLKGKAKITFSYYTHTHTPLSLCPLLVFLKWNGWSITSGQENHSIRLHRWNESWEVRKKGVGVLFQLQTNPPGEILFQCTLHFVALMPALNCFGTCHRYWWKTFSLHMTFSFIPFPLCPLFLPSPSQNSFSFCLGCSVTLY